MPFDTTYYFVNHNKSVRGTATIPGGEDTSIYLSPGQVPSDIDGMFAAGDSIIAQAYQSLIAPVDLQVIKQEPYEPGGNLVFIFIAGFIFIVYQLWKISTSPESYSKKIYGNNGEPKPRNYLTYYGFKLDFSDEKISHVLTLRFSYYNQLSAYNKEIFVERVQNFIADKVFKIHDEKGFKEMPILVAATAVQLTFGLKKYLLPHFHYIHIHPQEFLRIRPILCFLEGNVSGHSINLSWKHFLAGYANPNDGQNVGLHELAHALHYQNFIVGENIDRGFRNLFDSFNIDGNKAYHTEKMAEGGLYSTYAEKNFQEFWAETVEIFFEKPGDMKAHYPDLYETMKQLLNQDPLRRELSLDS